MNLLFFNDDPALSPILRIFSMMSRAQNQHQGQAGGSSPTHLIFVAFVTVSAKYRVVLFSFAIFVNQLGGLTKKVQNYKPDVCNQQTFLLPLSEAF